MAELFVYKAKIEKVIDGDTLDVNIDLGFDIWVKNRIRLYGVNTPETHTSNELEKVQGLKSKEFVQTWVSSYSNVVIKTIKDKHEKYGRLLAYVWEDGSESNMLNDLLIKNGLAQPYFGGKRD